MLRSKTNIVFQSFMIVLFFMIPALTMAQQIKPEEAVKERSTVVVPGTQLTLTLPAVFQYNAEQSAYIYSGAAASITVKELKGTPYASLVRGISKQGLESQGMQLMESSEITLENGQKAMLYLADLTVKGQGSDKDVEYERMIIFAGNENKSVWITANYPLITKSLLEPVLRECFGSLKF